MKKIGLIFVVLNLLSCSTIKFRSTQEIPVKLEADRENLKSVSFIVERKFFMWGLVPKEQTVDLDKVTIKEGYDHLSSLEIEEVKGSHTSIWSMVTFGMYYPRSFKITGKVLN